MAFDTPPLGPGHVEPFTIAVPDQDVQDFYTLLRLSKQAPETHESAQTDRSMGLNSAWLSDARAKWQAWSWRDFEKTTNRYPQYMAKVDAGDGQVDMHFVYLHSEKPDAVPLLFLHGWPGSFLEFLPILDLLRERYTPQTLPFKVVVPSLPGYAFSSYPRHRQWTLEDTADAIHKLMEALGVGSGYVAQGGDIGSRVARVLAVKYEACKAIHLNFAMFTAKPSTVQDTDVTPAEHVGLARMSEFMDSGVAYALEHATKPATIGLVLSSSPLALFCWIAEKFLIWTDDDLPLERIFEAVALYWFTDTLPRSLYAYRNNFSAERNVGGHATPQWYVKKPMGYSWFPKELAPMPVAWVKTTGELAWWKRHESGGHFAALEKPEALLDDVEEFVGQVWMQD